MKHDTGEEPIFGKFNTERLGQPLFICLWLALVTRLVYEPVFHAPFIRFDDPDYVTANPHILSGVTVANLRWATSFGCSHSSATRIMPSLVASPGTASHCCYSASASWRTRCWCHCQAWCCYSPTGPCGALRSTGLFACWLKSFHSSHSPSL